MSEPICSPCKDSGYNVIAHYQAVTSGSSRDGKAKPAMCYYHHFGMPLPSSITGKPSATKEADIVGQIKPEQEEPLLEHAKPARKCACGCGKELPIHYSWDFFRGHRKAMKQDHNLKDKQPVTPASSASSLPPSKLNGASATIEITQPFLDRWWASQTFDERLKMFKANWGLQ